MALKVGSRLGVFEVTGRLGEGGMGVVSPEASRLAPLAGEQ